MFVLKSACVRQNDCKDCDCETNMSCDSNNDELKLTKEYKYLLSYIRPLIDQLEKSRDAQLCLLWLSKLEQCEKWERNYRNKILSELCQQVKANYLKPPFSTSPPSGCLRNILTGDWGTSDWNTNECSEGDDSAEESMSCSSQHSQMSLKNLHEHTIHSPPWKGGYMYISPKNKGSSKFTNEVLDHSECFAVQKAYQERAQSDQMVIEKYQEIIKSLVSQQLKADFSPRRVKKLQATYETKMAELLHSRKRAQEENDLLRQKFESTARELNKLENLKCQNENLKKQVSELEEAKSLVEARYKKAEEENLLKVTDLIGKLNESEKQLMESEKHFQSLERKYKEICHVIETEHRSEMNDKEKKHFVVLSTLQKLLEEKQIEIVHLKEEITKQRADFDQEVFELKQNIGGNENFGKDKQKIKMLKSKARKLEKIQENMTVLFQSHLHQILAKKDFYIATLEMQLKMNNSESVGSNLGSDLRHVLNQKVSNLEAQYRKLLEDSELQSLKQRQEDLQKIHILEKQLLFSGMINDSKPSLNCLKAKSLTSLTAMECENYAGRTF